MEMKNTNAPKAQYNSLIVDFISQNSRSNLYKDK